MRIASRNGPDKVAGDTAGVMIEFDGDAVLSSRNRFPNMDLTDFDVRERVLGWELDAAPAPDGWWYYGKGPNHPRYTRQPGSKISMTRTVVDAVGGLIDGPEPPDATQTARMAPPGRMLVEIEDLTRVGLSQGFVCTALALVTGAPTTPGRRRITDAGPRSEPAFVNQGQGLRVPLYEKVAQGVTGIAILCTKPQATAAAALTAPLFRQRVVDVRRDIPPSYPLNGPFLNWYPDNQTNETYAGPKGRLPGPVYRRLSGDIDCDDMTGIGLSFMFHTSVGWSAPQQITNVASFPIRRLTKLSFQPRGVPADADLWLPLFTGKDGSWYALTPHRVGVAAYLYTNDPEKFPVRLKPDQTDRDQAVDATGVPTPDEAPDSPVAFGIAAAPPGRYGFRATWGDGDDESAPSPPVIVDLAMGQKAVIHRPPAAHVGKNPQFVERDPVRDLPLRWTLPDVPGVTRLPRLGNTRFEDRSGRIGKDTVARTPAHRHEGTTSTHRKNVKLVRAGANNAVANVHANVRKTDGTSVRQLVKRIVRLAGTAAAAGDPGEEIEVTIGEVGSGADLEVAGVLESDLELELDGEGFARDLDVELADWNVFRGFAASRKRWPRSPAATVERHDDPYPDAGYMVVVENPRTRPVVLDGLAVNMFEYFGPYKTPPTDTYGARGMKLPVKPGEDNVISAYFWWRGVTAGTTPLKAVVKNRFGHTVQTLNPMVGFAGSSKTVADADARGWIRRHVGFTAHPQAAYVEFVGGPMADGLVRMMGFQYERARLTPTTFTNENGVFGEIVSTFDTRVPGAPLDQEPFASHGGVKRLLRVGANFTLDPGGATSVDVDFACKNRADALWGPWVTDVALLDKTEQIRVRATLRSTDTLRSPTVHELYVDLLRPQPVFLRADGSEYPGGCVLVNLSAEANLQPVQERRFADNTRGWRDTGKPDRDVTYGLECYLDETAEEIMRSLGVGDSAFVLEDPDVSRRYKARSFNVRFKEPDRDAAILGAAGSIVGWFHNAEGCSGEVLERAAV